MAKLWKQCRCGIITDIDEEYCPIRGLNNNPIYLFEIREINDEELMRLNNQGKVWTKHQSWLRLIYNDPL